MSRVVPSLSDSALMALRLPSMDKAALLAPAAVARVAARGARRPEERWLLHQATRAHELRGAGARVSR